MPGWYSVVVPAVVVGGITLLLARTKPRESPDGSKTIRMNRPVLICILVAFTAFTLLAGYEAASAFVERDSEQFLLALLLAAGFGAVLPLAATALFTDMYDIYWDDHGITGASKVYGFGVRQSRITIPFADMRKMGMTLLQSIYVEDSAGRRIYWSQYYNGHAELEAEIARHLPGAG